MLKITDNERENGGTTLYRIVFLLQFLFLIGGIVYTGGETVPTSVSIIVSVSFLVMAIIQWMRDKSIYAKIVTFVAGIYLRFRII